MINMSSKELIKCVCGKNFPVNYSKHPNRTVVYCPFSGHGYKQRIVDASWVPNTDWWKNPLSKVSKAFTIEDLRRGIRGKLSKPDLKDEVGLSKKEKEAKIDTAFVTHRGWRPHHFIKPEPESVTVASDKPKS
jgi:hypothetical protein